MKPAREPTSSRPKPCASLKKPHASCPFAAPCGPRRKKNGRWSEISFSLRNLPVCAFDSRAQGLSPPLARQRSSRPPPSPSCGVCALSFHLFWTSDSFRYNMWTHQPGSQEESHAEFFFLLFFLPLPSAVLALIFIARGIQPFLSLVIHEIEFCVSTT